MLTTDVQIVDKFNIVEAHEINARWGNFHNIIECPECGDKTGHAGTFEDRDDAGNITEYMAHCVKCEVSFFIKNSRVARQAREGYKSSGPKNVWDIPRTRVRVKELNESFLNLFHYIQDHVPNAAEKTRRALQERGYTEAFINYLIKEGVGWYEPVKTPEEVSLLNAPVELPMFRQIWAGNDPNNKNKWYSMEYVQFERLFGLLVPCKMQGKIVGYNIRNQHETKGSRYMSFVTVNTARDRKGKKENPIVDDNTKFIPKFTLLEHDIPLDGIYNDVYGEESIRRELFIVEGSFKAQAIHFHWKERVMGVNGIGDLRSDEARRVMLDHRHRHVVLVPDRDFRTSYSVAKALYDTLVFLYTIDAKCSVLTWEHPDSTVNNTLKGVDDALEYNARHGGVIFRKITPQQFFLLMPWKARYHAAATHLKAGMLLSEDAVHKLDFVTKDDNSKILEPDEIYPRAAGGEIYAQLSAKHKLIVDISPTGTGKSHRFGTVKLNEFQKAHREEKLKNLPGYQFMKQESFSFMKGKKRKHDISQDKLDEIEASLPQKIKLVEQSPLNNTVSTLTDKRWVVKVGRNASGWVYDEKNMKYRQAKPGETPLEHLQPNCPQTADIIRLRNNRQVMEIRKDICLKCPYFKSCDYLQTIKKASEATYSRQSLSSLGVKEGDIVAIDDFGALEVFISLSITRKDIATLYQLLEARPDWKYEQPRIFRFMERVFDSVKKGSTGRQIYEDMYDTGEIDNLPIHQWKSMKEPDKVSEQHIRVDYSGIHTTDSRMDFKDVKRWFFLFLDVFTGKQAGNLFFQTNNKGEECWVIKGINPVFRDISEIASGIIVFDATASKEFLQTVFGLEPYVISAQGDPLKNVNVKLVEGFYTTNKSKLYVEKVRNETLAKFNWIAEDIKRHGKKAGVLTFKELTEDDMVRTILGDDVIMGYWWYTDRASNVYYNSGVEVLYLVGVPIPNISSTQAETDCSGKIISSYVARPYGVRKENGKMDYIITKDVGDPALREHLWYKRASGYIQALGRLRSVQQPDKNFELVIMDKVPLPFEVNEVVSVAPEEKTEYVDLNKHEKAMKTRYLNSMKTMFQGLIDEGFIGLSEDARNRLFSQGYDFANMLRYVDELSKHVDLQKMIEIVDRRIIEVQNESGSVIPEDLSGAEQLIDNEHTLVDRDEAAAALQKLTLDRLTPINVKTFYRHLKPKPFPQ